MKSLILATFTLFLSVFPTISAEEKPLNAFRELIQPTSLENSFRMEGYWIWGMSVIKGDDGLYHGYAARWQKSVPFAPNWVTNSEIIHATAEKPEGPFTFQSVALERRGKEFWDGQMTHNPTIHKSGDTYLLFYTGSSYDFPYPQEEASPQQYRQARFNQRIGLATSKSPYGPWERKEAPIIKPRPGKWDSGITVNPAVCVRPDGSILLVYKSTSRTGGKLELGVAEAKSFNEPFERLREDPIFQFPGTKKHVEDPYIWWSGERYELIMKDMNGGITGQGGAGIYATSLDGVDWQIADPALSYTKSVKLENGKVFRAAFLERAQLLVEGGKPTHLYLAIGEMGEGGKGHHGLKDSWNLCIPLGK